MIKFTFLSENKTYNQYCNGEHGLSILIETEEMKILFDTGASDLFAKNAKAIGADISEAEALVISHGHYDHTEGVPAFCQLNQKAPIYVHKDAFGHFYGKDNGEMETESCGILWNDQFKSNIKDQLRLTNGPIWLTKNIVISGAIPDIANNPPTEFFYKKKEDGSFEIDPMNHEQFLGIRDSRGIFIFSGCSHKGIIPIVEYAKELFPEEKLFAIIAGMHLYGADNETRKEVVEKIVSENFSVVVPVHCTGSDAIVMLKTALEEKCVVATAGDTYEYL